MRFVRKVSNADDFSFKYKTVGSEGVISIGKTGVYISQNNKLEIFENNEVRYIYNKRRNKLDIESVTEGDDSVSDIFLWIAENINYIVKVEAVERDGLYRYRLEERVKRRKRSFVSEVIDVFFNKDGDIVKLSYMSREMKRIVINISDFKVNDKSTLEYFTFNPKVRKDMDITDYRK